MPEHCIELLRQVVVCTSDISIVPWGWDEEKKEPYPMIYNEHTCRDFDLVREWAVEHRAKPGWKFDPSKTMVDEPNSEHV